MELNLTAPTSWAELTQEQLASLLKVIAVVNRSSLGHAYRSREDLPLIHISEPTRP